MDVTDTLMKTVPFYSGLLRTAIVAVHDDGTVSVLEPESGRTLACDVLESPGGLQVALAPGDPVLVWHSGAREDRGVVLGRIGRATRSADRELEGQLVIETPKGLTLRCGKGSISIKADGRILIKGEHIVSHARQLNRIRGAGVAIN